MKRLIEIKDEETSDDPIKCRRCKRKLTKPESIRRGMGSTCAYHEKMERQKTHIKVRLINMETHINNENV